MSVCGSSRLDSTRLRLINLDLSTKSRLVELVDIQVEDLVEKVENLVEKVEFLVEKVEIQIYFLVEKVDDLVELVESVEHVQNFEE